MIDIQVREGKPQLELSDSLKLKVKEFHFDDDAYVESLEHLGVPNEVIDTLSIQFMESGSSVARGPSWGAYDGKINRLSVGVGNRYDLRYTQHDRLTTFWPVFEPSRSATVNFALARAAQGMVDANLQREEKINYEKAKRGVKNYTGIVGKVSVVGAIGGAQVSEALEVYPTPAAIAGAIVGFAGAIGYSYFDGRENRTELSRTEKVLNDRQFDFANSQKARELFGSIVQIELVD